jgi:hypothetical protein
MNIAEYGEEKVGEERGGYYHLNYLVVRGLWGFNVIFR